jgi:hypothetical protein
MNDEVVTAVIVRGFATGGHDERVRRVGGERSDSVHSASARSLTAAAGRR